MNASFTIIAIQTDSWGACTCLARRCAWNAHASDTCRSSGAFLDALILPEVIQICIIFVLITACAIGFLTVTA
jgi:hypothetical protein